MQPQTFILDLRGLKCPLPVLKARRHLRDQPYGYEFVLESTDPLSVIDIPHFCREDGHSLIATAEEAGVFKFHIRKTGASAPA